MSTASSSTTPDRYAAPALDKGLDILELVADAPDGMTLTQLANALDRPPTQIFRMVVRLHERGYLRRTDGDAYHLTAKLFELAHRYPPMHRLIDHAMPVMRRLADRFDLSCHLTQMHGTDLVVVVSVEAPGPRCLLVRTGARFDPLKTGSGRLLIALGETPAVSLDTKETNRLRKQRHVHRRSRSLQGVIDLARPVYDQRGYAIAAMTVPFLTRRDQPGTTQDAVDRVLAQASDELTITLGGRHPD